MNVLESFRIALRALGANKVRSVLTMLGVIIGVSAVILLVSIGSGVQREVTGQIEGLGSNLLFIVPGDFSGAGGGTFGGGSSKQFTSEDVEYLRSRLDPENVVIPEYSGAARMRVGNRTMYAAMTCSDENVSSASIGTLAGGRWYSRGEVIGASRVVVIGSGVKDQLFPGISDPIGMDVKIEGQTFQVIGYLEARGGNILGSQDNNISIPITTAQQLTGTNQINAIMVKTATVDDVERVRAQVERIMTPRFGEDFTVFTQQQTLSIMSTLLGTLTSMLAGLAAISLLVGGIGIMNIMLVSVSERTREIGIRKAVGARTYDILSQFMIEAVVLSVFGGVLGILVGGGGALIINNWLPTQVTLWSVALAFLFSAVVGVFFGVYPAYRASRLDPIEALRYE
ncbi:MAG: ABC transporter permease [Coriobacteriia bacterium]